MFLSQKVYTKNSLLVSLFPMILRNWFTVTRVKVFVLFFYTLVSYFHQLCKAVEQIEQLLFFHLSQTSVCNGTCNTTEFIQGYFYYSLCSFIARIHIVIISSMLFHNIGLKITDSVSSVFEYHSNILLSRLCYIFFNLR